MMAGEQEGVRAAAEAVTQTSEAVEKGGDAMASFVAAADPVTALEVVDVAGRTASAFPPINWLVDAMTFVHYSVPLSWAATAVCFTVAFRTLILPAVRRRGRPDSLPSTHHDSHLLRVRHCVRSGGAHDAKQRQDARCSAWYLQALAL
jgi:hypothetical protein